MNFKRFHESKNLFDVSTVEKGRIDNGEVGYVSQTSSLTIEGGTVSFTTTTAYRGVCSGFFEIPNGTETITFNFIRNEALGVKFVFYDSAKTWLNQDYTPQLLDIPPATANVPIGAKYVRLSFTGQIVGGYSYTMSNIMLNTGSTALPYEPYSSEVWHDIPHYIHNTSTDTITTLPAVLYPNATTATVGLKGQAVQSGTPTPDNPIMPEGMGNKTANLSNVSDYTNNNTDTRTYLALRILMSKNGGQTETFSSSMQGTGENSFTFTLTTEADTMRIVHNGSQRNLLIEELTGEFSGTYTYSFDLESNDPTTIGGLVLNDIMLNTGSTALPYEPYGYKIQISSAGQATPVYLGEVESTRRIKKLVLTGEETSWTVLNPYYTVSADNVRSWSGCICTHCAYNGIIGGNSNTRLWIKQTSFPDYQTLEDFKTYLQQQYAAGTPVCVWYVLATEETAVVNEPLMKIGNYADEVSNVSIPVTAGGDTLSVGTTVQPSEVTVNYKGWHPVQNAHEYDYLLASNPLCGIGAYKDELNLATGACTRHIKKLVLTGQESWNRAGSTHGYFTNLPSAAKTVGASGIISSHYQSSMSSADGTIRVAQGSVEVLIYDNYTSAADFKSYLAAQYAAGTPVCVWYVLATPTTETITVPSGLSGTEEGYLNQSGTPTPTNPIYPTANEVKIWT